MLKRKHIILKYFLSVLLLLVSFAISNAQTTASAELDTNIIRIGEQAKLRLTVLYRIDKGEVKIKWPQFKDSIASKIEIVEQTKIDTSIRDKVDQYLFQQTKTIIITSYDSGFWAIPPIKFIVNNDTNNIVETEPLLIQVGGVKVDTTQAIKDIKPPIEEPFSFKELIPYIGWGLLIIAIITGIVWIIYRYKKNKPIIVIPPKPKIPAHVIALEELEKLKTEKLWEQGNIKQYHSRLTDILRAYIEDRFKISALEQTSDEIISAMKYAVIDDESKVKLKRILFLADLVKFAKEQPVAGENEQSMQLSYDFINGTKREEMVEEKKEEA